MNTERSADSGRLAWRKSSHSGPEGGDCVEVAGTADAVLVRDSKNRRGAVLPLSRDAWAAFLPRVEDTPFS